MDPKATVILHETKKMMPSAKKATLITPTGMEIPYHSVKTTTRRICKLISDRRLAIRTQKPQKDSTATRLTGQGVKPLQTFVYLQGMTALRNVPGLII